jgi:GC-rich sequence DNA-binding factor
VVASALEQTRISNEGPRYDAEYLKELKASTPNSRPRLPVTEGTYDADMSMDIGDVPMVLVELETGTYLNFTLVNVNIMYSVETGLDIPSESSIKVAKEKRERLRKAKAAGEEDFISLSVTRRDEVPQGPHPESRLVREEDQLGEGDDGQSASTIYLICSWKFIQLFFHHCRICRIH